MIPSDFFKTISTLVFRYEATIFWGAAEAQRKSENKQKLKDPIVYTPARQPFNKK
jgi:hypothetical protein